MKNKVKIKFSQHQYYDDLNNPMFYAGKVYEIDNTPGWVMRWMKRGGEIIEETEEVVVEEVKEQAPVENMAEEIKEEAPEAVETSYKPKKNKGNKKDLL